jgi:hypothetical protein
VSGSDGPRANARWTVVNSDLLGRHRKALCSIAWAVMAIDEAHYIKNDSARTKHVLRLAGLPTGPVSRRSSTCSPAPP